MSYYANFYFKSGIESSEVAEKYIMNLINDMDIDTVLDIYDYNFLSEIFNGLKFEVLADRFLQYISQKELKIFYIKEFNLLAFPFINNELMNEWTDGSFCFQNSGDNNYNLEEYSLFPNEIIEVINRFNSDDVINYFEDDLDNIGESIQYFSDCYRYERLIQCLGLNDFLGAYRPEKSDIVEVLPVQIDINFSFKEWTEQDKEKIREYFKQYYRDDKLQK